MILLMRGVILLVRMSRIGGTGDFLLMREVFLNWAVSA